jgi:hypothetical protein
MRQVWVKNVALMIFNTVIEITQLPERKVWPVNEFVEMGDFKESTANDILKVPVAIIS